MGLNIIKLCVGVETVDELESWIVQRMKFRLANGRPLEQIHTTRMFPKRSDEIIGKGSLYWVIKGRVQCRQPIVDLRPVVDAEGISRCEIVLEPKLILTRQQPKRPFQGWRYYKAEDAPADLTPGELGQAEMPAEMQAELAELGLI